MSNDINEFWENQVDPDLTKVQKQIKQQVKDSVNKSVSEIEKSKRELLEEHNFEW